VLLRTAIGWHFLNEGMEKLFPEDGKPFTSEPYLRASVGPAAPRFRALVPDCNGIARLERDAAGRPARLEAQWTSELDQFAGHYRFTSEQRARAEDALKTASATADNWFRDPENAQKIQKYKDDLSRVEALESNPTALAYQRLLAYKQRPDLEAQRRELNQPIDAWTRALRDSWLKLVTPQQSRVRGPLRAPWTNLDWINATTKFGLTAIGACLMLGLFTRMAAQGAAGYLALFYLSMPPWPGLPEGPKVEGHYFIVNKNLIELLACMVLATTRTGLWIGLDAVLFGAGARRRDARAAARAAAREPAEPESRDPYSDPEALRRRGAQFRRIK
jgi:uncharacterized membrane protein YphA (DoxX/SURF4 family)